MDPPLEQLCELVRLKIADRRYRGGDSSDGHGVQSDACCHAVPRMIRDDKGGMGLLCSSVCAKFKNSLSNTVDILVERTG